MKDDIVIVGAVRTPVGAFNGAFGSMPAHELGKVAIKAAIDRAGVEASRVSEVILGQILQAGQGQGPARQASINAGIPVEVPAWSVNQLCGSGLRAVALGYQGIVNGESSEIAVVGGQEFDEHGPALRASAQRCEDGQFRDGRHGPGSGGLNGSTQTGVNFAGQITGSGGLTINGGSGGNLPATAPYLLVLDGNANNYTGNTTINNATVANDAVLDPGVNILPATTVLTLTNSAVYAYWSGVFPRLRIET